MCGFDVGNGRLGVESRGLWGGVGVWWGEGEYVLAKLLLD